MFDEDEQDYRTMRLFPDDREVDSIQATAPIGAARVSKRFPDTLANF